MACAECLDYFLASEWVITVPHPTNPRTSIPRHEWCFPAALKDKVNHTFCPECSKDHVKETCTVCRADVSHHRLDCHCADSLFDDFYNE